MNKAMTSDFGQVDRPGYDIRPKSTPSDPIAGAVDLSPDDLISHVEQLTTEDDEITADFDALCQAVRVVIRAPVPVTSPILVYPPAPNQKKWEGFMWPGTITLIKGKTGEHKSRIAGLFSSLFMAEYRPAGNMLGFERRTSGPLVVLYADSERPGMTDFAEVAQRMKMDAGYAMNEDAPFFYSLPVVNVERKERMGKLLHYAKQLRKRHGCEVLVVIDQIADFVKKNINDPDDATETCGMVARAAETGLTFLVVIHENPGTSDKARGWLGTELQQKARVILQMKAQRNRDGSETGNYVLKVEKRSKGPKNQEIITRYDAATDGLVLTDGSEARTDDYAMLPLSDVADALHEILGPVNNQEPVPQPKLAELVQEKLGGKLPLIKSRLSDMSVRAYPCLDMLGRPWVLKMQKVAGKGAAMWCHLEKGPGFAEAAAKQAMR